MRAFRSLAGVLVLGLSDWHAVFVVEAWLVGWASDDEAAGVDGGVVVAA